MAATVAKPTTPTSDDKRWRVVDATMRRNGYQPNALNSKRFTALKRCLGFLDQDALTYVASALHAAPSRVYAVATFYNHFTLNPQGAHTWSSVPAPPAISKGALKLMAAVDTTLHIKPGETTPDKQVSLLQARCLGSCSLATRPVSSMARSSACSRPTTSSTDWRGGIIMLTEPHASPTVGSDGFEPPACELQVCMAAGCLSMQSDTLKAALETELRTHGLAPHSQRRRMPGPLPRWPLVAVKPEDTLYQGVTAADAPEIVARIGHEPVGRLLLPTDSPFFHRQTKIVLSTAA